MSDESLRTTFGLAILLLVLLAMSVPFVDSGSAEYYALLTSFVVLVPTLVGSAYLIYRNRKREVETG